MCCGRGGGGGALITLLSRLFLVLAFFPTAVTTLVGLYYLCAVCLACLLYWGGCAVDEAWEPVRSQFTQRLVVLVSALKCLPCE